MRADAQRNYDRIVEVARQVFRERGYDASLDDIAKLAGVGPGTLYRHFPNRETLLDAVMQSWVDRVSETTDKALTHEGSDREVLLSWFEEYVGLISQHRGGPAKITSAMGNPDSPIRTKCGVLADANDRVIEQLRADGRAVIAPRSASDGRAESRGRARSRTTAPAPDEPESSRR